MAHSKKVENATWTKQWNCNKIVFIKDTRRPSLSDKSFNLTNWRQFLCVCPLIYDKMTSWAEGLNLLKKCKHWNVCLFLNWRNLSSIAFIVAHWLQLMKNDAVSLATNLTGSVTLKWKTQFKNLNAIKNPFGLIMHVCIKSHSSEFRKPTSDHWLNSSSVMALAAA